MKAYETEGSPLMRECGWEEEEEEEEEKAETEEEWEEFIHVFPT